MKLTSLTLSFALLAGSAAALAETKPANTFDTFNGSKKTATTTYTLEKSKSGLKVKSSIDYLADGKGGAHVHTYRIGTDGIIDDAALVNPSDHTTTFYTPSKANDALDIAVIKDSKPAGKRTVALQQPDIIFAFKDDPSVWQVLLEVTAAHPHTDKIYRLFVPSPDGKAGDRIEPYILNEPSEATGKLAGNPITLKDYQLRFNSGISHIYTDADGNLMQAQITPLKVTHTRADFILDK